MDKQAIEKQEIKVSIVVPMYMCEKYVRDVLASLCAQDLEDIEIICVIDGSPDESLEIAKDCARGDSRIRVIHKEHGGAGTARNLGLDNAKGEYVMFLDADDVFETSFVSQMHKAISEADADIALCHYTRNNAWSGTCVTNAGFEDRLLASGSLINPECIPDIICAVSSAVHNRIYKKSFIHDSKIRFSSTNSLNDSFFASATMVSAKRVALINKKLYTYRAHHNTNSITSNRNRSMQDVITVLSDIYEWLKENNKNEYYKESFCKKWRRSFAMYCRYGANDDFQNAVVKYLLESEPWSLMDDRILYREAGLSSGIARVHKRIWEHKLEKKSKRGEKIEVPERLLRHYKAEEENKRRIREKLQVLHGKNVNKKDSIIGDGLLMMKEMGLAQSLSKLTREIYHRDKGM